MKLMVRNIHRNAQDDYLLRRILFSATEVYVHPTNMVRDHIAGDLFLYATVCVQHGWQQVIGLLGWISIVGGYTLCLGT